ncbi:class I SAM-dependent methyltransferase [Nakamurella deserti]|uniref:class I SAM-dependent methyltransferase n=1 Tax=Nakamurella deserti TaxID=2164074 RepID=UPI00197C3B79|nr:class I SAM-dependent methyltransferase [Nakamurella deserti]
MAYDVVAADYADLVRLDRAETMLDRALIADFADRVRGRGRVLDAGCGPGRLTRHLADLGVDAVGVDLSPEMVRIARERHPDLDVSVGDLDALPAADGSLAGVLAWYSVIHTRPAALPGVLAELLRVLRPGGWLLIAVQSGTGSRHLASAYGHNIDLTAYLHTADALAGDLEALGATVHLRTTRGPEGAERRPQAFVLARRPPDPGGTPDPRDAARSPEPAAG